MRNAALPLENGRSQWIVDSALRLSVNRRALLPIRSHISPTTPQQVQRILGPKAATGDATVITVPKRP
jgi:hypothetical protein